MPRGNGMGPPTGDTPRGGRMSGTHAGVGPGGYCVCPSCRERIPHTQGTPCYSVSCPKCGAKMVRE